MIFVSDARVDPGAVVVPVVNTEIADVTMFGCFCLLNDAYWTDIVWVVFL